MRGVQEAAEANPNLGAIPKSVGAMKGTATARAVFVPGQNNLANRELLVFSLPFAVSVNFSLSRSSINLQII